jgi:hypothetical protein
MSELLNEKILKFLVKEAAIKEVPAEAEDKSQKEDTAGEEV